MRQLLAQRAFEGPDEPILLALARVDFMPVDLVFASRFQDRSTSEISAVIADDASRFAIEPYRRSDLMRHSGN